MNNQPDKAAALAKIATINTVEGFDPAPLAVDYVDMNTGDARKRLPVMVQVAWFRLKYPEGRFTFDIRAESGYFVAKAKVYAHYNLPLEQYLSEATASRGFLPDKPTVSPREWAQTAALGIALRNAGFGLQFHAAGESFDDAAVDELGELVKPAIPHTGSGSAAPPVPIPVHEAATGEAQISIAEPIATDEDPFDAAKKMPCPITKHKGKTLGDMIAIDPNALVWVANKFTGDAALSAAAKLICEQALAATA
jgi:hypothetical protein